MANTFRSILLAAAMFATAASAAQPTAVVIDRFAFSPQEITVKPGTTVVWTNRDQTPHTVSSGDKSFASKGLDTDDTFAFTFTREAISRTCAPCTRT